MKIIDGRVMTCSVCLGEYRRPLPPGWSFTTHPSRKLGMVVRIHTDWCPKKFPPVVIPDV